MDHSHCVFCAIVERKAPATYVEGWPDAIAIIPLNPVVEGHRLVIPRVHVPDAMAEPIVTGAVFARAAELADIESLIDFNLITSCGANATQTVFHLHVHLVPRHEGDGLHLPWTGQAQVGENVVVDKSS